jgi:hypothetical protein
MKCAFCGIEIEPGSKFCIGCGKPVGILNGVLIGRDPGNDIVVDHDRISRLHAIMTRDGELFRITDRNSLNGVWVNGRRITSALVTPDDRISLGNVTDLDWSEIRQAFGLGEPKPAPETASLLSGSAPGGRMSPAWTYAIIALLVLAGMAAAYYFLMRDNAGAGKKHLFRIEYTYRTRPGEEHNMSIRRSLLETRENILAKVASEFDIQNSLALAYSLAELNIGEPQYQSGASTIVRTATAIITDQEYETRMDYLSAHPSLLTDIGTADQQLQKLRTQLRHEELLLSAMEYAASEDSLKKRSAPGSIPPYVPDPADTLSSAQSIAFHLQAYDDALREMETVYESLNLIRSELAGVIPE